MLDSPAKVTRWLRREAENNAATEKSEKAPREPTSRSRAKLEPKKQNLASPMRTELRDRAELPAKYREELPASPQARSLPASLRATLSEGEYLTLPGRHQPWFGPALLFVLIVLLPFASFAAYLFFIASPRYVAEFHFSVTQVTPTSGLLPPAIQSNGQASALSSLASSLAGASSGATGGTQSAASPQNFIVTDYLRSSQAVDDLTARINLPKLYERSDIDWWSRLRQNAAPEDTMQYWQNMVSTNYDVITGLATASVVAFSPRDAYNIATELVKLSEELVNKIASRPYQDAVKFAQNEVTRAQKNLDSARDALADFRDKEGVVDPTQGVVPTNINVSATIETTLAQAEATLDTMRKQQLDPSSIVWQKQVATVKATRDQLKALEQEVANRREDKTVLTHVVEKYEALDLNRQYAQALLLNAYQSLDRAKATAASQTLYLTPYVYPSMPVKATGMNKMEALLVAAGALMGIWLVVVMVYRAFRHSLAHA